MAQFEIKSRGILLDIEGTVTPVAFVYNTLFPYARAHGPAFLKKHWHDDSLREARKQLIEQNKSDRESGAPAIYGNTSEVDSSSVIDYFGWLIDRDSKATALKHIQGLIWRQGFESGELKSELFPDVVRALRRWSDERRTVAIYSSGSVLAQQQLFEHTTEGDVRPLLRAYFDTSVGAKREASSYVRITRELDIPVEQILFVSDILQELEAADSAGLQTRLCVRPGNAPIPKAHNYPVIRTFDELF